MATKVVKEEVIRARVDKNLKYRLKKMCKEKKISMSQLIINMIENEVNKYEFKMKNKKIIDSVQPVLASFAQKLSQGVKLKPDQVKYFQELLTTQKAKQQEQEDCMKEMQSLQAILDESANARVEVTGEVFGGTRICIADVSMVVKNSMNYCKFIKSQGDVKMVAL